MTGGGGTTTSTTTGTTYTSALPEYAEPYYHDLMQRTALETQQPYVAYEDERIAGFTPATQQAFAQIEDIAAQDHAGVAAAQQTAADVAAYTGTPITTQTLEGYDLSGYIDPYLQQTLDIL